MDPLLVQLDWFFTSTVWTLKFPNTLVNPLARPTSDHVPCVVSIGTSIPKAKVSCFENH
jgi:endonuclease/exonuclease/phosphatase family metal-dependent hydrolase